MTHPFDAVLNATQRALGQVVAPSIDPANPLAREQLALVARFLKLIALRADAVGDRARAELALSVRAAECLSALAPSFAPADIQAQLAHALQAGFACLLDVHAPASQAREAGARLDALESALARFASTAPLDVRRGVRKAILASAAPRLALRRAWFQPLGLDPEPATVPGWDSACREALRDAAAHAAAGSRSDPLYQGDKP